MRALELPLRLEAVEAALSEKPELGGYVGDDQLGNLGRDLGRELAAGGETPLWDALEGELVEVREGGLARSGRRGDRDADGRAAGGRELALPRRHLPGARQRRRARRRRRADPRRAERDPCLPAPPALDRRRDRHAGRRARRCCSCWPISTPPATTASATPPTGSCRRSSRSPRRVGEPLTILIAARDEEERIGTTVEELRRQFPDAEVIVADDGSRDATAAAAEAAGALVVRLPHRGKGQALTHRRAARGRGRPAALRRRPPRRPAAAARRRRRPDGRRVRPQAGRRLRDREAGGAAADPARRPATTPVSRSRASARLTQRRP